MKPHGYSLHSLSLHAVEANPCAVNSLAGVVAPAFLLRVIAVYLKAVNGDGGNRGVRYFHSGTH